MYLDFNCFGVIRSHVHSTPTSISWCWGAMAKTQTTSKEMDELIQRIVELTGIARKGGMMAGRSRNTRCFLIMGYKCFDGADEAKLTVQMKKELKAMQVRHEKNIGVAQSWVDIAQRGNDWNLSWFGCNVR